MKGKKDVFDNLYIKLKESGGWPKVYMFKFILPAENEKIARVQSLFNAAESEINQRQSREGNYISITVKEMMISPEKVIERYYKAAEIEGVMIL